MSCPSLEPSVPWSPLEVNRPGLSGGHFHPQHQGLYCGDIPPPYWCFNEPGQYKFNQILGQTKVPVRLYKDNCEFGLSYYLIELLNLAKSQSLYKIPYSNFSSRILLLVLGLSQI